MADEKYFYHISKAPLFPLLSRFYLILIFTISSILSYHFRLEKNFSRLEAQTHNIILPQNEVSFHNDFQIIKGQHDPGIAQTFVS